MNYEIIVNEKLLNEFIEWLPDPAPHETFFIGLFSRPKYLRAAGLEHIPGLGGQVKRFTTDKRYMVNKIRQLESAVGTYRVRDEPIPQQALALYISPNPRDMIKATKASVKKLLDLVTRDGYDGYNPHHEVMSEMQKASSDRIWCDFDFDGQTVDDVAEGASALVDIKRCKLLATHGGCHLLVNLRYTETYVKRWYQGITGLPGCDVRGDTLLPVPGCTQGGFVPHFVDPPVDLGGMVKE